METKLELLALVVLSAFASTAGYRLAKRLPRQRTPLLSAGLILVLFPLTAIFPEYAYWFYPSFTYGELLFAFAFAWIGMLVGYYGHSPRHRVLTTVLAGVLAYFLYSGPIFLALYSDGVRKLNFEVRKGVTVQETFYTCIPSSLATVLRRWGYEYTEGELAYALRTSYEGTPTARVPALLSRLQLDPPLKASATMTSFDELARINLPAILEGTEGPIRHAVALIELDDVWVTIGDPLRGPIRTKREELDRFFQWNGKAIIIQPAGTVPAKAPHLRP
jgi:predicted double-glycine peptidase